jgi:hypothetical protein
MLPLTVPPLMMTVAASMRASTSAPSPMMITPSPKISPRNLPSMRTLPAKWSLPSNWVPWPSNAVISSSGRMGCIALLSSTLRPSFGAEPPLALAGSDQTGELATNERAHARFTSRWLVLDPERRELTLQGDARLSAGRYHVRGERLTLSWPKNELSLAGPARVSWCPCEPAAVALRFEHLTLSSAGTLQLSQPVLELGGVPVLWAPWLRIEPPDRFGLLPLELAWRGDDGLFAGGGVHVPLGSAGTSYVQLSGGAYTAGGFALAAASASPTSASWVRWEALAGTGLWLDLRGSAGSEGGPVVAWAADAIRGRRGVLGTLELARAARASL